MNGNREEDSFITFIAGLFVVGMIIWGVRACTNYADEHPMICTKYKVTTIGQCTEATADAWNGTNRGTCRVVLSNGNRVNMSAPVMLGDEYQICESK